MPFTQLKHHLPSINKVLALRLSNSFQYLWKQQRMFNYTMDIIRSSKRHIVLFLPGLVHRTMSSELVLNPLCLNSPSKILSALLPGLVHRAMSFVPLNHQ